MCPKNVAPRNITLALVHLEMSMNTCPTHNHSNMWAFNLTLLIKQSRQKQKDNIGCNQHPVNPGCSSGFRGQMAASVELTSQLDHKTEELHCRYLTDYINVCAHTHNQFCPMQMQSQQTCWTCSRWFDSFIKFFTFLYV